MRLESNKVTRFLQSTPNYDILAESTYREMFMYVPTAIPNRTKYIISEYKKKEMKKYTCDIVRMCVEMAYFKDDLIKKVEFSPAYLHCEKPTTSDRREAMK